MYIHTFLFWTLILLLIEEHRIKMDKAHPLLYMQGLTTGKQYWDHGLSEYFPHHWISWFLQHLEFLMALLFCETCFYVLCRIPASELSIISSLLKATPTSCFACCLAGFWRRKGLWDAWGWCVGTRGVLTLVAMGREESRKAEMKFSASGLHLLQSNSYALLPLFVAWM